MNFDFKNLLFLFNFQHNQFSEEKKISHLHLCSNNCYLNQIDWLENLGQKNFQGCHFSAFYVDFCFIDHDFWRIVIVRGRGCFDVGCEKKKKKEFCQMICE